MPLVSILAPEQMQPLDVVGPYVVFANTARARQFLGRPAAGYEVEVLGTSRRREVAGMNGLSLVPHRPYWDRTGRIDTLIVAGGPGAREATADQRLIAWIRDAAKRSRRIASVCTGAFLLAEAGLLDRRRATTHWYSCTELARLYPRVRVETNPIYVKDGKVWSSAGVTAGMDMALAMVEEDHGSDIALAVARGLVLYLRRPGGQDQYSAALDSQRATRPDLRELMSRVRERPASDLSVEALAAHVAMSPRHFTRVFSREFGSTPARWVERIRVEAARQRLEQSAEGVEEVAAASGFSSAEVMRRAFLRVVHVSPNEYRARFSRKVAG
ncbi:MAG: DJ-1/PfpI family protein [Bryobacteraceae bacterium]